jgi:GMP synthase (glutamine-hydrolysing)
VQKHIESFFTRLFDQVVANDFPFLGACSGNGLLGKYCGATVSTKYAEPVGSVSVTTTEEGEKDALLAGMPKHFPALVGHKESCEDVPPGAVLLITSKPCPVQMFRVRKNIYATQFHPEADVDEFILRIKTYKNHGYFPPEKAEELIAGLRDIDTPVTKEILRRFVRRYQNDDRAEYLTHRRGTSGDREL